MRTVVINALVGACMGLLAGCSGDPIVEVVSVAPGLNDNAVQLAVLMAIADAGIPSGVIVGQPIDERTLAAVLEGEPKKHSAWTYESREAGTVFAGYERHHGYLRVAIRCTATEVTLTTVEDRDVHHNRNVEAALQSLEARINRAMKTVQRQAVTQGSR